MEKVGKPYKRTKLDEPYDVIVIGSGIGGLTAAALLGMHGGQRVLVLERHFVAGGFTHAFERPGYEWDVGVHYIGEVHDRKFVTRRLLDQLTEGRLLWEPMGDVYDRIFIGDDEYPFYAGADRFRAGLLEAFPDEGPAIDGYIETVRAAIRHSERYFTEKALPGPLASLVGWYLRRPFLKFSDRTTAEVLCSLTSNSRLRAVLAGQFGDYGLPPSRSSFAIHAMVAHHYLDGACYPVGGSSAIAAGIAPLIEKQGGAIVISAEVDEIRLEKGRAVGVRMADGREIRARRVVSDAGIHNTFSRLLPRDAAARFGFHCVLAGLEPSVAHLCLYVGLKHTDAELGLSRANLWLYPNEDHDANVAAFLADPEASLPLVFASFPSAKDPVFHARYPGRSTIDLITLASYGWFAAWEDGRWQRRGDEYEALKQRFADRMLETLYRRLPQLRGKIDHAELSTPLTTRHFVNYVRGEMYGLAHTPARFRRRDLRPRTPVPGLWLTGQDVASAGVAGALYGGVLTASAILGSNVLGKLPDA